MKKPVQKATVPPPSFLELISIKRMALFAFITLVAAKIVLSVVAIQIAVTTAPIEGIAFAVCPTAVEER